MEMFICVIDTHYRLIISNLIKPGKVFGVR